MVIDTALSWFSLLTIYIKAKVALIPEQLVERLLSLHDSNILSPYLNWQSWLASNPKNIVEEIPDSHTNIVAANYEQFAMMTLFLITVLGTSLLLSVYNLYKHKKKAKKSTCIIDDVSYKLDQQSRFLRTQERLLELLRNQNSNLRKQQSELFALINHELKNPLTAIKTNFVAWFRLASYDEVTLDRARLVENSITRLEAFCDQAGSMHELASQSDCSTDFSQLLQRLCEEYRAQNLDMTGLTIDVKVDARYSVPGKSNQLSALVSNLINYGAKRSVPGSKMILELQQGDSNLVLKITEPGFRGITKTASFVEAAQQTEIEYGPELFFASRVAQFLNVVITTRTDEVTGAVTSVTFPEFDVLPEHIDAIENDEPILYFDHQQHPVMELCGPSASSPRCLILDDDPQLQSCLGRSLSKHFNVKGVFDTETAMAETRQWQPNLIISEVRLGSCHSGAGGDTFDTIKKMKCSSDTNDIPVIILSTQDSVENRLRMLEMNIFTFFAKPFSEELLSKTALRLCSNSAAKKELQNIQEKIPFQQSRDTIFLNQLNALIESNLDNVDFHFEDYFDQFSLSKRQFFRRVNALTRCTPKQYLINKRLELARHLLSKGVLLEKVTKSCGFRDTKALTKLYQAHYGEEII